MKKQTANKSIIVKSTMASIFALGASLAAQNAFAVPDAPANWEKCAGVSMAGRNDCGSLSGTHQCAGQAKDHMLKTEWVYVPEGTCTKLGGIVKATKPAK